ncbi:MAG: GNAT family N-acetyltransferase [Parachlamydia sp.]|nr:GNAT family N-acetyltransferase [Parachlamydia sp.]
MIKPHISTPDDYKQWIQLAREVESLFGPMVEDPNFQEGLRQAISEGNAFCIRKTNGGDEEPLPGGIVVSREANEILWFAVAENCRGAGIGKALLKEAIVCLDHKREIAVTTFDNSVESGFAARRLYLTFGFKDSMPGAMNPAGIPTVVMVRPVGDANHCIQADAAEPRR